MHAPRSRIWSKMGRWLSVLVALALLVGAIAWMSGSFHSKVQPGAVAHEEQALEGRTLVPVELLTTTETVDAVGTVQPRRKTDVSSQILATIREIKVNSGDRVGVGQTLIVLDDREVQAQLREAEAAVTAALADLHVRTQDFDRYEKMYRENAVTREDYDRIEGALKTAQAYLKRAQEQAARIKVMQSYTEVKAQAAGIVGDRYADPGDLASPGKPLLTLYDPKDRELHASVPESLAGHVQLNMDLPVRIDAVNRQCHGTVREIVPQAQQSSRSVLVKVTLPAEAARMEGKGIIYIGMFGRVWIPTGSTDRIVAPEAAVLHVGQEDLVEVARPDGTLERRFVRIGRQYGDRVEVLSGLKVGEQVAIPKGA